MTVMAPSSPDNDQQTRPITYRLRLWLTKSSRRVSRPDLSAARAAASEAFIAYLKDRDYEISEYEDEGTYSYEWKF